MIFQDLPASSGIFPLKPASQMPLMSLVDTWAEYLWVNPGVGCYLSMGGGWSDNRCTYKTIYIYTYVRICINIYIYIWIQRDNHICIYVYVCIYIYIYHVYAFISIWSTFYGPNCDHLWLQEDGLRWLRSHGWPLRHPLRQGTSPSMRPGAKTGAAPRRRVAGNEGLCDNS